MFTISDILASPNAAPQPPSKNDLCEIQSILNQGHFVDRTLPEGDSLKIVRQVWDQVANQYGALVCHTVAKKVANALSGSGWQHATGYLIKNRVGISFLNQARYMKMPPDFTIDKQLGRVYPWLLHHSVALDGAGNYIECLPDYYPIKDFTFIPHHSGALGYFLEVSW
jgi:hypothetical protein